MDAVKAITDRSCADFTISKCVLIEIEVQFTCVEIFKAENKPMFV